MEMQIYN